MTSTSQHNKERLRASTVSVARGGFTPTLTSLVRRMKRTFYTLLLGSDKSHGYGSKVSVSSDTMSERGFTLIEVFVAVSVLLIGIAGPLQIATERFYNDRLTRDRTIATFLAYDAMESLERSFTDFVPGDDFWWTGSFSSNSGGHQARGGCFSRNCVRDNTTLGIGNRYTYACVSNDNCPHLALDPDTHLYGYRDEEWNEYTTSRYETSYPPGHRYYDITERSDWELTKFVRYFRLRGVNYIDGTDGVPREIRIDVTVEWETRKGTESVTLRRYVYNLRNDTDEKE